MNSITWFNCRQEPVIETEHEAFVESTPEGPQVVCNYLWCTYVETFKTYEDAETAAEIHGEVVESSYEEAG